MGEVIGTIIALVIIGLLFSWIGWPVAALAEAERITVGHAFLVFLVGSIGIFAVVAAITYFVTEEAQAHTYSPRVDTAPSASRSASERPMGSKFTPDGLITGHTVSGRKVAAYETHRIAGFEFLFAVVPWPREKFRIYILKSPDYASRATDALSTHRFHDGSLGRHYICVDKPAYPNDLTNAREIALMWAQATARYIKIGKKFG